MSTHTQLLRFLADHERFSGCYFWSAPCSARQRRDMEFERVISFELAGIVYYFEQSVSCSCRNIYYRSTIMVDGKTKNIRALKKLVGAA